MRDIRIRVEGPRDQAQQTVTFNLRQNEQQGAAARDELVALARQLREATAAFALAEADRQRLQDGLDTIEREAKAQPRDETSLELALRIIGKVLSTVSVSARVLDLFHGLARAAGFVLDVI